MCVHNRAPDDSRVARMEALREAIVMEPLVEGIKVGKTRVKLSQFADDTGLGLGNTLEIEPALRAIKYWCDATGMRENAKKREGLAMGKYR